MGEEQARERTGNKSDLIVLSDLHLGEGSAPGTHRFAPTEDFFHDGAFSRFVSHLRERYQGRPGEVVLILNGDVFDFLTVTRIPTDKEAAERGFQVSANERKFGLDATEAKSIYKLDVIFNGHRGFFKALALFLSDGHRLEILRGNHDLEIFFKGVRRRIVEHLASFEESPSMEEVDELVRFHQFFYLEEGRVLIEHGHQYDSTNSNRYPSMPVLGPKDGIGDDEGTAGERILDYPLGSIFVKYFYNRVRLLDPYAPRLVSPEQYMDFIRRYNLFDVWRVYKDHYPYFIAALGPNISMGSSRSSQEEDDAQEARFVEMSKKHGTGDLFHRWNQLKIHPESASKPAIVKKVAEPVVKRVLWFGVFAFVAMYLWFLILHLIRSVPMIAANAFFTSLFAVVTIGGMAWAWIHFRRKLRGSKRKRKRKKSEYVERAHRLAQLGKVPLVIMGHTHMVDHQVLEGGVRYANSGTWTSVSNPWSRIMRDARRLTLLKVTGNEAEILRWNDDAARFDFVPMFRLGDDDEPPLDTIPFRGKGSSEPGWDHEHSWLPSSIIDRDPISEAEEGKEED